MAKRLHNMILSAVCVHIRARTNLVADGGRLHTCTRHTLTVSPLLTQTHFEHVQTHSANTDAHMHALSGDTPHPPGRQQAGPSVPRGRDRKTEKEISGPSDVCVIYNPTPCSLSLSLSLLFFILLFPKFQAANSAVCQLLSQSREYTCKHSFCLNLLCSLSDTQASHLCPCTSLAK